MVTEKKEKGVQVNATIPPAWNAVIDEHKWKVKMKKTDLVKTYVKRGMIEDGLIDHDGNVLIQTPGSDGAPEPDVI